MDGQVRNVMKRAKQAMLLYEMAIAMKQYDVSALRWRWRRNRLLYELWCMRIATARLRTSAEEERLADDYLSLLDRMDNILADSEDLLRCRGKGYRENVRKNLLAFHNLPRAFLSVTDRAKLTPHDAWEYSKAYLR